MGALFVLLMAPPTCCWVGAASAWQMLKSCVSVDRKRLQVLLCPQPSEDTLKQQPFLLTSSSLPPEMQRRRRSGHETESWSNQAAVVALRHSVNLIGTVASLLRTRHFVVLASKKRACGIYLIKVKYRHFHSQPFIWALLVVLTEKSSNPFFSQACPWTCPCPPRLCPQDLVLEFFEIDLQVLNRRTARSWWSEELQGPFLQWSMHLQSGTQSAALKRPQHWLSLSSHIPLYICVGCSSVCTWARMFSA